MPLAYQVHDNMKEDNIEIIQSDGCGKSDSEIIKFFDGQTLFITGVTGYLGKCLMEKLLRSCSEIQHIYVLMREHKKKSPEERMGRYFDDVVFHRLKQECPGYRKKVTMLRGDLMAENLGLSEEDRNTIINNVSVIYHNGANVKFDIRPSLSLKSNVLGTKKMLELAQQCKNIKVFVYVSTAYSHCYKKDIEEEFYPPPADLKSVYKTIEADEKTENGLPENEVLALIGKYPNIYTYSKGIAEDVVKQYAKNAKFTHTIYRPSIVMSANKEPLPGYVGNTNGPVYIFIAAALGFFRVLYHLGYPMDFIPSDMTINALLAITNDACVQWNNNQRQPQIYNYCSSTLNPIDFFMIRDIFNKVIPANERSIKAVWLNNPLLLTRKWVFYILHFFLHFLPACLLDLVLYASGKKPKLLNIFWQVTQHLDKIDYWGNGNWKIHMPRTLAVIDKMKTADEQIFYCDIRKIFWEEHLLVTWHGLKTHILKEKIVNEAGRRRYLVLWYLHYASITILFLGMCYGLYSITRMFF